jgi:hypothetical protein
MDLHPCTVQLRLENRGTAEPFERLRNTGRSLGEHRADGLSDLEGELLQRDHA